MGGDIKEVERLYFSQTNDDRRVDTDGGSNDGDKDGDKDSDEDPANYMDVSIMINTCMASFSFLEHIHVHERWKGAAKSIWVTDCILIV